MPRPSYRLAIFGSTFVALALYVVTAAYVLPNIAVGFDAVFHWFGAATIRGWGAALNGDQGVVKHLVDGVYGEARFALILLTMGCFVFQCFVRPSITKVDTLWWTLKAFITLMVIYTLIDILSIKSPKMIESLVQGSGTVIGRIFFDLSGVEAGPMFVSAFGSMFVMLLALTLWVVTAWVIWAIRRK